MKSLEREMGINGKGGGETQGKGSWKEGNGKERHRTGETREGKTGGRKAMGKRAMNTLDKIE